MGDLCLAHRCNSTVKKAFSLIAISVVCAITSGTGAQTPTEYQVKAAFLYNFARFIEWPDRAFRDPGSPMTFCVQGEDPFGHDLDRALDSKTVGVRELTIKRFKGVQGLETCQVLFIGSSDEERVSQIVQTLKNSPVLTVGDMERFAKLGGIINFVTEKNKVRFEINLDAAERAGLKVSSKLLTVARVIRDGR
jgi:hypothetical protein